MTSLNVASGAVRLDSSWLLKELRFVGKVAPCYLGHVAPQGRVEAIARIHALAQAQFVDLHKRAQRRMEDLNYDITDVEDCLCALRLEDCVGDGAPEHLEYGGNAWVYEFVTPFRDDDLYLKVYLYPDSVYVLSFKLDGSPA